MKLHISLSNGRPPLQACKGALQSRAVKKVVKKTTKRQVGNHLWPVGCAAMAPTLNCNRTAIPRCKEVPPCCKAWNHEHFSRFLHLAPLKG